MKNRVIGPITMAAKIYFTVEQNGRQMVGAAEYSFPPGQPVSEKKMVEAIGAVMDNLQSGSELMPPDDFFNNVIVKEMTGRRGNFALPQSFVYNVEKLTEQAAETYAPIKAEKKAKDAERAAQGEEFDDDDEFEDE